MQQLQNKYELQCQSAKSVKAFAYFADQNYPIRMSMEDECICEDNIANGIGLFGIIDGHGGKDVAVFCRDFLPKEFKKVYSNYEQQKKQNKVDEFFNEVFQNIDNQVKCVGASECGACCNLVMIKQGYLHCANLGDTRAIVIEEVNSKLSVKQISTDHKVTSNENEVKRIKQAGAFIIKQRVQGSLAVTRAIGDIDLKDKGVIAQPEVTSIQLTASHKYCIIACDGLWDVCQNYDQVLEILKSKSNPLDIAKHLVMFALKNGSRDNVSVLVLKLNDINATSTK